ncbi:uncharacterized protein LOC123234076 [Gracilinanus agilis]|uniref:uncharacterized protein LOC123234076 n=1 Tax=Gracilinanus agilis TaxID=191870 RepID=UPI001CFCBD04|nr:uncharacterized protein LOC123234076 [Gracilinanus agilis]
MDSLSQLRTHNPGQWVELSPVSMLVLQIDQKLLEQIEVEGLKSKSMEKRSIRVPSLKKRHPECPALGAKLAERRNLQKKIPFQPWAPFTTIFSPLQTTKQHNQEREPSRKQHLGIRGTSSASFLSPGAILDGASPAPRNLAEAQYRKLSGCLEREAPFYLSARHSKSPEIQLMTSLEGPAGLSLQVLSSNTGLPEAQGLSLEPRARPLSFLSGNPTEKLANTIILPRPWDVRRGSEGAQPQHSGKGEALERCWRNGGSGVDTRKEENIVSSKAEPFTPAPRP